LVILRYRDFLYLTTKMDFMIVLLVISRKGHRTQEVKLADAPPQTYDKPKTFPAPLKERLMIVWREGVLYFHTTLIFNP